MSSSTLYDSIIWQLRKTIFARGLTMQQCDDLSGNQDGYTAKMLHPDTKQGRQARWESIENLVLALHPSGFKLTIAGEKESIPNGFGTVEKRQKMAGSGRIPIRDFARLAGMKSWQVRSAKMRPGQWKAFCRKAARSRWRKNKILSAQ